MNSLFSDSESAASYMNFNLACVNLKVHLQSII